MKPVKSQVVDERSAPAGETFVGDEDDDDDGQLADEYQVVQLPPGVIVTTGEDGQMYFVQTAKQEPAEDSSVIQNYNYTVDPTSGNIFINSGNDDGRGEERSQAASDESVSSTCTLRMLSNGCYVVPNSLELESATFHYAKETGSKMDDGDGGGGGDEELSELRVSNVTSIADNALIPNSNAQAKTLGKVCLWSRRKTADLITCIQNHEHKFRKSMKKKTNIWNDISKDMADLGHGDCDRDECSKKWSNLYRTWKKVKLRPREFRRKWEYYTGVSILVKSLTSRYREKVPVKKSKVMSTDDLVLKFLECTSAREEAYKISSDAFKEKVDALNKERDELLGDIKNVLARKMVKCTDRVHKPENLMNANTSTHCQIQSKLDRPPITIEGASCSRKAIKNNHTSVYYLHILQDYESNTQQCQLVEMDSSREFACAVNPNSFESCGEN